MLQPRGVVDPRTAVIDSHIALAFKSVPFQAQALNFFLAIYAGLLASIGITTPPRSLPELQRILESVGLTVWRGAIPYSLGDHFVVNPYSMKDLGTAAQNADGDRKKFDWGVRRGVLDSMIGALCVSPFEIDEDIFGQPIPLAVQAAMIDGAIRDGMLSPSAILLSGDARAPELRGGYPQIVPGKSLHAHFGYTPLSLFDPAQKALRIEINRLLVAIFHSDPMVGNPGRLMRVGGVVAWKNGFYDSPTPRVQTLLAAHQQVYSAEEVRDSLRRVVEVRGIDVDRTIEYQAELRRQRLAEANQQAEGRVGCNSSLAGPHRHRAGSYPHAAITVPDTRNQAGEFDLATQLAQIAGTTTLTTIREVAASLQIGMKQRCHCPFHTDGTPSAFISLTVRGTPFLYCSSGCGTIWAARAIEEEIRADLPGYDQPTKPQTTPPPTPTTEPTNQPNYFPELAPLLRPETRLLFLIGAMGTGKTHQEALLASTKEKIIGLTSRRSLVREAARRFDAVVHEDVFGPLTQDRVWACINSAARIPVMTDCFEVIQRDLLIIAEGEQTRANLYSSGMVGEDSGPIYERVRSIARSTGLTIVDDAFLSQESIAFYTRMTGVTPDQIQIISHGTPDSTKEIVKFESWEDIVSSIIQAVSAEERCYIAVTSKSMAKVLGRKLAQEFPQINLKIYHSEIDEQTRQELSEVNNAWADVDVVVASPTIASGVSFDLPDHFDRVYLLASSVKGIGWADLLQQVGRVRHPKLNKLFVWAAGNEFYDCTNRDLVRQRLQRFADETKNTAKLLDLRIECDPEGRPVCNPLNPEHFEGYLDHLIVTRRRSNRTALSLFAFWKHWKNPITPVPGLSKAARKVIRTQFRELRQEIEGEEIEAVQDAEPISVAAGRAIEEHGARTIEEANSAERARILDFYGMVNEGLIESERKHRLSHEIRERINLALAVEGKDELLVQPDARAILSGFDANIRNVALRAQVIQQIIEASPIPVQSLVAGLRITNAQTTEQPVPVADTLPGESEMQTLSNGGGINVNGKCNDNSLLNLSHNLLSHNLRSTINTTQAGCATPPRNTEQTRQVSWSNLSLQGSGFVARVEELNERYNFKEMLGLGLPIDFADNPAKFLGRILRHVGVRTKSREIRTPGGGKMRIYSVDWDHLAILDALSARYNRRRRGLSVQDVQQIEEGKVESGDVVPQPVVSGISRLEKETVLVFPAELRQRKSDPTCSTVCLKPRWSTDKPVFVSAKEVKRTAGPSRPEKGWWHSVYTVVI